MNKKIEQAVILAGGIGTRLRPFTEYAPKPMFPIHGIPFIKYLIEQIKDMGICDILILLGYMPEVIMKTFRDGKDLGVNIRYSVTAVEYNTGMRLKCAQNMLQKDFLLMYCDNYCPIDFEGLCKAYYRNDAWIQMSAYVNADNYTKSNLLVGENGLVEVYDKKGNTPNLRGVDIGYAIVNRNVIDYCQERNDSFEEKIYPLLVKQKKLFAYCTEHRYYSIGSYARIELTQKFFLKRKVIFLDRDGTLNKKAAKACYIERVEDFIWLPQAREAIKLLKDNGYFIIIITNQPGIARGKLTEEMLNRIHNKMLADLNEIGASIDKILYCSHDWDEGCDCRKPKPGMLYKAQREFSLNLPECIVVGDDERDMLAGKAARCKTYLVDEQNSLYDIVKKLI